SGRGVGGGRPVGGRRPCSAGRPGGARRRPRTTASQRRPPPRGRPRGGGARRALRPEADVRPAGRRDNVRRGAAGGDRVMVVVGAGTGRRGTCPYPDIDLADPAFWRLPMDKREAAFARLRRLPSPVFFVERPASRARRMRGFHALVRHRDVVDASRKPEVFISGPGVTTPKPAGWVRRVFGDSMVNLDDPRHANLRGIVQKAFTPRVIAKITADMEIVAAQLVEDVAARGTGDFVELVAAQMPLRVICEMMGIPERYRATLLAQLNQATENAGVGRSRWRRVPGRSLFALARMHRVVAEVGRRRRLEPTDDLISALVTANVDGKRLTSRELGSFFSLLLVAGVETTRNAIAHGLRLITENP